jgi:hypothetical protein
MSEREDQSGDREIGTWSAANGCCASLRWTNIVQDARGQGSVGRGW